MAKYLYYSRIQLVTTSENHCFNWMMFNDVLIHVLCMAEQLGGCSILNRKKKRLWIHDGDHLVLLTTFSISRWNTYKSYEVIYINVIWDLGIMPTCNLYFLVELSRRHCPINANNSKCKYVISIFVTFCHVAINKK